MSDQEDDKKISNDELSSSENENQSKVDEKNQPEDVKIDNEATSSEENPENQTPTVENQNNEPNEYVSASNNDQTADNLETSDSSNEKKDENVGSSHQVIHKKDGRLHIYVRQDKYKGELKSKNWVGRLYIDGKQKISSSGTTNLEEAIPILEKWFDDVHEESEKLKKQTEEVKNTENQSQPETVQSQTSVEEVTNPVSSVSTEPSQTNEVAPQAQTTSTPLDEKVEPTQTDEAKSKLANIFGKLKDIKLKKPSFANNLTKSSLTSFNKGNIGGLKSKFESFFKSKLGKSTAKGEEILGVQLFNNEIRLVQVSSNKANQWVLEKLYIHPVEITDDSSPIDNADKFSEELSLAIQKSKITTANAAIAIPVTSAIIRVVTAPLMKDEELEKAIETNSLWENLVQLTDNLEDYSIFHQVISRNQKDNTMDILFVASKLSDINSYTSIIKNAGLNPVIIDVKCFALKSAVDQVNQLTNKTEDANLTAVLEFGLDENYLMILYDNNPIITDIFIRGQDRKILQGSQDAEEKEALVRRYVTQVKQAIQDFETKYEKRIRNIKVVSDIENVDEYLGSFRKFLLNVGFNTLDPTEGLKIPTQFQAIIDQKQNKSFLTTAIGLAFRKLDVFGYYKFVTAVKNINLLPDRSSMMKQKKMKAISGFAFKGVVGLVAGIYLILFGMSFWNIYSYNKKLTDYEKVKVEHSKSVKQKKVVRKELGRIETSLKLSRTLKSNKDLTYRALAQIASSVPKRVRFDKVDFDGRNRITIQGVAATDQDILKFIDNLGKQKLVSQASLSSMRLPKRSRGGASMKGFRVFVTLKKG
tara:strand:- start:1103 stop:3547 length:2445 start_codon:yes stop_codon:yes gene_type:complete